MLKRLVNAAATTWAGFYFAVSLVFTVVVGGGLLWVLGPVVAGALLLFGAVGLSGWLWLRLTPIEQIVAALFSIPLEGESQTRLNRHARFWLGAALGYGTLYYLGSTTIGQSAFSFVAVHAVPIVLALLVGFYGYDICWSRKQK